MAPSNTDKPGFEIIREAMKARNVGYLEISEALGERRDKLAVAVRCSNGSGKRAIELRRKVAEFLDLSPEEVWDEVYLSTTRSGAGKRAKRAVKRASDLSPEEWKAYDASKRVRSLLREMNPSFDLRILSEALGITYPVLATVLYGRSTKREYREAVASFLGVAISEIWAEGGDASDPRSLDELLAEEPAIAALHGFGPVSALAGIAA